MHPLPITPAQVRCARVCLRIRMFVCLVCWCIHVFVCLSLCVCPIPSPNPPAQVRCARCSHPGVLSLSSDALATGAEGGAAAAAFEAAAVCSTCQARMQASMRPKFVHDMSNVSGAPPRGMWWDAVGHSGAASAATLGIGGSGSAGLCEVECGGTQWGGQRCHPWYWWERQRRPL